MYSRFRMPLYIPPCLQRAAALFGCTFYLLRTVPTQATVAPDPSPPPLADPPSVWTHSPLDGLESYMLFALFFSALCTDSTHILHIEDGSLLAWINHQYDLATVFGAG